MVTKIQKLLKIEKYQVNFKIGTDNVKRLHKNKCKWTINIYLKRIHSNHFKNASPNNFMAFFSYQNIRQHLSYIFHNFDVCGEADTSTHHSWEYKLLELNLEYVYQNLKSAEPLLVIYLLNTLTHQCTVLCI